MDVQRSPCHHIKTRVLTLVVLSATHLKYVSALTHPQRISCWTGRCRTGSFARDNFALQVAVDTSDTSDGGRSFRNFTTNDTTSVNAAAAAAAAAAVDDNGREPANSNYNNGRRYRVVNQKNSQNNGNNYNKNNNYNNYNNDFRSQKLLRDRQQFRKYLRNLSREIRNARTLANRMDDELKSMEMARYNIQPSSDYDNYNGQRQQHRKHRAVVDTRLQCRYPDQVQYKGPVVDPDVSCYAMVASCYAKAGLGRTGAELAEQVLDRCDEYSKHQRPNTILKTACMNAWIHADDWDMTDYWLQNMEGTYQQTRHKADAPDVVAYTHYIVGLAASRKLSVEEIVTRCDLLLEKMHKLTDSGENPFACPNQHTYNAAMKCHARALQPQDRRRPHKTKRNKYNQDNMHINDDDNDSNNRMDVVKGMERLLRDMQDRYAATGNPAFEPNPLCYTPIAHAASCCNGGIEAARYIETLIEEQKEIQATTGDNEKGPLDGMYSFCFTAYSKVDPTDAAEAAERVRVLLPEMEEMMERKRMIPSIQSYTAAINGLTVGTAAFENTAEAETILRRMPEVDKVAYQCVIKAYARSGQPEQADKLLWELHDCAMKDNRMQPPDVVTIAACANAWVSGEVKNTKRALERSMKLLDLIVQAYKNGEVLPQHRHVDSWIFENVMHLWVMSQRTDAGEQVEKLIDTMVDLSATVSNRFEPKYTIYTLALDAWAKSGHKDAGRRVIKWLERMHGLAEERKIPELNNRVLTSALASITRERSPLGVDFSQKLFQRVLERYSNGDNSTAINVRTFSSVLTSLANSNLKDAAVKSVELVDQLRTLREQGLPEFSLNTIAYNCVLDLCAKRGLTDLAEKMLAEMLDLAAEGEPCGPDIVSYSCVCRAYSRSNNPHGAERTMAILSEVEEKYRNGNKKLKPDRLLYNAALASLSRASLLDATAAEKAHNLLMQMELSLVASDNPLRPDLFSYVCVCQAYALSSAPNASDYAEELVRRVENLAENGTLPQPDERFYSAIALAFARSLKLDEAEAVVRRMEELGAEGRRNVRPTTVTYNALLNGWAHSRISDRLQKAIGLLQEMKGSASSSGRDRDGPDIFSYNWVVLAAARAKDLSPEERILAFHVALDLFRELHDEASKVAPNSFTYSYFLRACSILLPSGEERNKLMTKTLEICLSKGLVSNDVWDHSVSSMPEILKTILDTEKVSYGDDLSGNIVLPSHWTENLPVSNRNT